MRAVRLSTCALHMASSWGLLGSRRSLSIVYLLISVSEAPDAAGVFHACPSKAQRKTSERPSQGLCSGRGAKWAQHSPAKALRRGSVRKGARKGLRTAHRKTSKSPSKVGALLLILFRGIPEHLGKKNKGSTRCTDAPLVRETDTCTRPEGARGSVRAMPEHSTCRDDVVVTDEHSHPATRERCY